ncbi:MAG: hypothetical protein AAF702_02275 [Chloroflexota bacterium]
MKFLNVFLALALIVTLVGCSLLPMGSTNSANITTSATGEVITNIQARGTGGGAPFDGTVDTASDLDALGETAWGVARLGLHRGHAPIEGVLEEYLGISHDEMHVFMEEDGLNLAGICEHFGFDPENLVETLTASFVPFLEEGVENGVISNDEVEAWTEKMRTEFSNRVYWEG